MEVVVGKSNKQGSLPRIKNSLHEFGFLFFFLGLGRFGRSVFLLGVFLLFF